MNEARSGKFTQSSVGKKYNKPSNISDVPICLSQRATYMGNSISLQSKSEFDNNSKSPILQSNGTNSGKPLVFPLDSSKSLYDSSSSKCNCIGIYIISSKPRAGRGTSHPLVN